MNESCPYIPLSELRELKTLTRSQIIRLEALNTDGTGFLKAEDILQVLENDHRKQSQKLFFNKLILLLILSGVILICALCGITYGVVSSVNELNVDNDDHVLKTSANGEIAGLGAVVNTESAESVLSSMEPWGITRINFVNEETGEYGFISINAIQAIENGATLVRTVLGDEYIVDESGGLVVFNETNSRKLLFWDDIVSGFTGAYQSFEQNVIKPVTDGLNDAFKDVFGISLDTLLAAIAAGEASMQKSTVEVVMEILNFVSPKMASCLKNFKATNLDCYTFFPCFDFMRRNMESALNDCRDHSNKKYCIENAIQGLMDQNSDAIINFLGAIAPTLRQCILGNPDACKDLISCLASGRKLV